MAYRYVCTVLDEMRELFKTYNFSPMLSLIEEIQSMVNRMESALGEMHDCERWHKKAKEEEAEYKRLLEKTNELRKKAGEKQKDTHRQHT